MRVLQLFYNLVHPQVVVQVIFRYFRHKYLWVLTLGSDASNARPSQKHNVHDSQRMQNRFSTWQSSPDADAMSTSSMPPAYRDLSTRGPHPSRSPSIANDTGGQMSGTTHFVKSAFTRNLPCEDILSSRSPFNGSGNEHSPLGASSLDSRTALNLDSSLRHSYLSGMLVYGLSHTDIGCLIHDL